MSEAATDQIPWGDHLGEAWWRAAGEQIKASEQQVKLAACLFAGTTKTAAARLAGYSSDEERARKSGSEAAKTTRVTTLLALATAEVRSRNLPSAPKTMMSRDEALEKLTDIARGADKSLALRAIEAIGKNEAQPNEIGKFAMRDDGFGDWRIVRDYLRMQGGASAIASIYMGMGGDLGAIPLLHDVIEILKRDEPEFLDLIRRRHSKIGLAILDQQLADPDWQRPARLKLWLEIGVDLDAAKSIAAALNEYDSTNSSAEALAKRGAETDHARGIGR